MPTPSIGRTAAIVVTLTLAVASVSSTAEKAGTAAPRAHTVSIKGMIFEPATLEVSVGDTIVWVNDDLVPHTATAIVDGARVFDSGVFPAKATWKYVAVEAGTIPYVCLLHPKMKGTLIVR